MTTSSSVPLQQSMDCVLSVFAEVGLPVAPSKLESPTICITFLGIQIDSSVHDISSSSGKTGDFTGTDSVMVGVSILYS